jgi:hypothetical protein
MHHPGLLGERYWNWRRTIFSVLVATINSRPWWSFCTFNLIGVQLDVRLWQ